MVHPANPITVMTPQWQTGPIPKPKTLCVLVLETNDDPEAHCSYMSTFGQYVHYGWHGVGGMSLKRYIPEDPRKCGFTGRWFIQPIAMPQPQPKLPPRWQVILYWIVLWTCLAMWVLPILHHYLTN